LILPVHLVSGALTPLIFIMVFTLFVMAVNSLSWIGSRLSACCCVRPFFAFVVFPVVFC
jgi:hypothetical protein